MSAVKLVPMLISLVCVLLSQIPLPFLSLLTSPDMVLISLFYWGQARPSNLPLWGVFIIGLARDVLAGTPLGLYALLYMVFVLFLPNLRKIDFSRFSYLWLGFSLFSLGFWLSFWSIFSFYLQYRLPFEDMVGQWLITAIFYPILYWIFQIIDAKLTEVG